MAFVDETAPENEITYSCEFCGNEIGAGDVILWIYGSCFCQECAQYHCADILMQSGAEACCINVPVCECCKTEILGKYIAFDGRRYCWECVQKHGEEIIRQI